MSHSRRSRCNSVNKIGRRRAFERLEARELMTVAPQWFETVTAASAASSGQRDYVVSLNSNFATSPNDAQQKLSAGGVQVLEGLGLDGSLHIRFGGTQAALKSMPGIRSVFPDTAVKATDDPMTGTAWNYSRIGAPNAWQYDGANGEGTIVAVVDTGIDFAHPDLQSRLARNWAEVGENGIDDDQNGFIDDIYGYDFHNNDNIAADDNRHGTHVSGTIVGASNGLGTQGIAFNAGVMPLKALGANGFGTISSIVRSINYATLQKQRGANVVAINLSLSTTSDNPTLRQAIETATAAGIVVVAAAGNNEADLNIQPVFPAAFNMPGLITVAATASNDTRARFSNFGTGVDIAAPGNQILSTVPGGGFTYLSGTSMAAPHVAGAIALLRSALPSASVDTVIDALYRGAESVPNLGVAGNRRLNIANSVDILISGVPQAADFGKQPWNAGTSYRGFMIDPSDFSDSNNRVAKLDELARWNVNLVRWQMLMYGDDNRNIAQQFADATSSLLASLSDFRRAGISVIVDFHPRNNLGENIGLSLPLQEQLVAAWRQLATVLRSNSTVVAYDVFNEPPMAVGTWNALLKKLVAGIRQVDRSTPILISPARTDPANITKLPRFAPEQNVVYTMHMYDPMGYTHQGLKRDETRNWPVNAKYDQARHDRTMATLQRVRNWQNSFPEASRPRIYVGEFSVVREFQDLTDSDGDGNVTERLPVHGTTKYLRDVITKFEQYGWDWSYHAYDEAQEWDLRLGNPQDLELIKSQFQKNAKTHRGTTDSPKNLRVANILPRTVDLHWDDPSIHETEFRVAMSRDNGANWDQVGVLAANSTGFGIENLNPGTRYLFKVRAANGVGYSEYSNTIDVSTSIEPPAAPANLRVANTWARTVDLNWDDLSNNETEFRVAMSRDNGANWDQVGVLAANSTGFGVENLNPGTRYLFKVRAANGEGYSEYSNTIDVITRIELPAAPANLRVANIWARTIDLNWNDLSNNETEFRIAISRDGGANWDNVGVLAANSTGFRVENLNPGTRYLFKVRAANGEGYSEYSNTIDVTTRIEPPAAPASLRVANTWARTIDLNWNDLSNNETEFRIAISRDGGANWDNVGVLAANSTGFRVENLNPGTRYLFKVRAANGEGHSEYSNTIDVTTRIEPPAAPASLRVANIWARTIDLNWDDLSNNETEFRIAISRDGGANWDNVGVLAANSTGFRVENLNPGTRYLFKVRAANGEGYSEYSNTIDVTTRIEPPAAPANLRVANTWARTVDLNWDDLSNNETEFRIAISRDGGANWDNVGVLAANSTGFRVENLNPDTRYLFKVRAANGEGYSEYSNTIDVTTRIEPPAAPASLRVANTWARTVDLNWDDLSNNETEFRVAISRDGGANWDNVGVLAANSTGFRVENLNPGTRYLFKVRAANGEGYSEYSNTIDVTTRIEPPAAPANLRVANIWARTIDLNWNDLSNNETEFRIAISRDGGANWDNVAIAGANATSFRIENLNPNTRYLFKIRAANSEGYSDYSNTLDVRTKS